MGKHRINSSLDGLSGYITVQEKKWYGWHTIAEYSVFVYGIDKAISMAERTLHLLST